MPSHASSVSTPYRLPAYYLTPDTHDYPLVVLVESQGDAFGCGDDLPVAHGVTLLRDLFGDPDLARRAAEQVRGTPLR